MIILNFDEKFIEKKTENIDRKKNMYCYVFTWSSPSIMICVFINCGHTVDFCVWYNFFSFLVWLDRIWYGGNNYHSIFDVRTQKRMKRKRKTCLSICLSVCWTISLRLLCDTFIVSSIWYRHSIVDDWTGITKKKLFVFFLHLPFFPIQ